MIWFVVRGKSTTILNFLKRKNIDISNVNTNDASFPTTSSVDIAISKNPQTKFQKIKFDEINIGSLVLI